MPAQPFDECIFGCEDCPLVIKSQCPVYHEWMERVEQSEPLSARKPAQVSVKEVN